MPHRFPSPARLAEALLMLGIPALAILFVAHVRLNASSPNPFGQPSATTAEIAAARATLSHAYALEFRAAAGLPDDDAYVSAVESDPTASHKFGLALTRDELQQLESRDDVITLLIAPLTRTLEQDPHFAGLYLDSPTGGVLDIATTGDPAVMSSTVGAIAQGKFEFRVRQVSNSLDELRALQEQVSNDSQHWVEQGVAVVAAGIDVRANRTIVTVASLTVAAKFQFLQRYGANVEVVRGGPVIL
jgi:hypothetical protein